MNIREGAPVLQIRKEKNEIMTTLFMSSGSSDLGIFEDPLVDAARQGFQKHTMAITATFTAEPVGESLAYWMQELLLPSTITFAPYFQLFQQLLDPTSLLSHNQRGINMILLRFEDWQRFETDAEQGKIAEEKIERHVYELTQHVIPGNHITRRTEHLPVLAERLRDCVIKAQSIAIS